ncbi:fetal alzheimer antigen: falz-like protein [Leptotrombidium deliense]|uniref:Fetal alzheimer antigen: falz-like protein n=1 Tax=Leptotrombidium deliense TaxID=299467 RepID=A0A443ST90_9ACAR|nr:fetal alzheimer antigen: falz-like protein [Leptotrombidium deliense]
MDQFICKQCQLQEKEEEQREQQVHNSVEEESYCICKEKEYDESKFYICCDLCEKWFHGKCVGLLQKEADDLPEYRCPKCDPNSHLNRTNLKPLNEKERKEMFQILQQIKLTTKYSWPFLKPVDRNEVANYYQIIKEPIDLSKIETKTYINLASFVADFSLMFENCFYFNDTKSQVYHCAEQLQQIFIHKIQMFRKLL